MVDKDNLSETDQINRVSKCSVQTRVGVNVPYTCEYAGGNRMNSSRAVEYQLHRGRKAQVPWRKGWGGSPPFPTGATREENEKAARPDLNGNCQGLVNWTVRASRPMSDRAFSVVQCTAVAPRFQNSGRTSSDLHQTMIFSMEPSPNSTIAGSEGEL
ncbi:unnamed protein product [Fusarium graminearum]|nr:unnamed protein product [Fusarium graminearum]